MKRSTVRCAMLSGLCFLLVSFVGAQQPINTIGIPVVIDFTGFDASGFDPNPAAGQLDSDTWSVLGFSDNDTLTFGATSLGGDFARGLSTGGENTGGVYAFDHGAGDVALGVQPTANDFTPGAFILRLQNNTGTLITKLQVSYELFKLNNADRSNYFGVAHSPDNITYTDVVALNDTSIAMAAPTPWDSIWKSTLITGLNIPNGSFYYLRWHGDDVGGAGNRDEFGVDSISVTGLNDPITADFYAANVCFGDSMYFQDSSTTLNGVINQWFWDFGDGLGISTMQHPAYLYNNPGAYQCTLVVINTLFEIDTLVQTVTVYDTPLAGFSPSIASGCGPLMVSFTDTSTAPDNDSITAWFWDFGDGDTSVMMNPSNSFDTAGTYNVMHIVWTSSSCSDTAWTIITVDPDPIIDPANVTVSDENCGANDGSIMGIIVMGQAPITIQWEDAGMNVVGTSVNLTGIGGGTYTLYVTGGGGCTATSGPYAINSLGAPPAPTANGPAGPVCEGDVAMLTATPGSGGTITWYSDSVLTNVLGTGNNYTTPGLLAGTYTYYITETTNCESLAAVATFTVEPLPMPGFTFTTNGLQVNFTNQSSGATTYQWDFGDNQTSTLLDPSHTYAANGNYVVTLIAISAAGCLDTITDTVSIAVGMRENSLSSGFRIYPNPTRTGKVTLVFNGFADPETEIMVFDVIGEIVLLRKPGEGFGTRLELDLSDQPLGNYFVHVKNAQEVYSRKLTINK